MGKRAGIFLFVAVIGAAVFFSAMNNEDETITGLQVGGEVTPICSCPIIDPDGPDGGQWTVDDGCAIGYKHTGMCSHTTCKLRLFHGYDKGHTIEQVANCRSSQPERCWCPKDDHYMDGWGREWTKIQDCPASSFSCGNDKCEYVLVDQGGNVAGKMSFDCYGEN